MMYSDGGPGTELVNGKAPALSQASVPEASAAADRRPAESCGKLG
jgi:hypothetical protein